MIKGYEKRKGGLLGETLSHSLSPEIHRAFADYSYRLFEVQRDDLKTFMASDAFDFLNVTIPYKRAVLPFLDEMTPVALAVGAVNTVKKDGGKMIGHNTDVYGFSYLLDYEKIDVKGKKILILGSGGASLCARFVLSEKGASEIVTVCRTGEDNYQNIEKHKDADVIVNATPVGMFPHADDPLLFSLDGFEKLTSVVDLVYRPLKTRLLRDAEKRGIKAVNGLLMLVAQAKEAAEFFTGRSISEKEIFPIKNHIETEMQNIVLIGMPGCGKTTIGKAIAKRLDRPFFDVDEMIEKRYQKSPSVFITTEGEKAFREAEAHTMHELSKENGSVIALGGGGVLHETAMEDLMQNGYFVYLCRDIKKLDVKDRPISLSMPLSELFAKREAYYLKYANKTCQNNDIDETIDCILKDFIK